MEDKKNVKTKMVSVRLSDSSSRDLARLVKLTGTSSSIVIRDAIEALAAKLLPAQKVPAPFGKIPTPPPKPAFGGR